MEGESALKKLMNLAVENEDRRERKTKDGGRQDQGKAKDEEDEQEIDACGEGGEYHSMVSEKEGGRGLGRERGRERDDKGIESELRRVPK